MILITSCSGLNYRAKREFSCDGEIVTIINPSEKLFNLYKTTTPLDSGSTTAITNKTTRYLYGGSQYDQWIQIQ